MVLKLNLDFKEKVEDFDFTLSCTNNTQDVRSRSNLPSPQFSILTQPVTPESRQKLNYTSFIHMLNQQIIYSLLTNDFWKIFAISESS